MPGSTRPAIPERTYVRYPRVVPTYFAADRDRPWIILFQARDLTELAAAISAQPDPRAFEVRASDGAGTRDLTPDERACLPQDPG